MRRGRRVDQINVVDGFGPTFFLLQPSGRDGGRTKGVPNKLTTGAKEVIAQVAENVGGVARMTKWVLEGKENERVFWSSIYTKLLPLQVAGDQDDPTDKIEVMIVDPKN